MRSKIAKIISGSTAEIYQELLEDLTYAKPHEFVGKSYDRYRDIRLTDNPSVNGRIFEYLICETLAREGIVPFYYQAQFTLVPEADFDIVLYDERFPVVLTMKTSLRERYKQAVLEGLALARVYPRAQSHLIALSDEGNKVSEKIGN